MKNMFNSKNPKLLVLFFLIAFLILACPGQAQEVKAADNNSVTLYLFYLKTCPYCHNELVFLSKLKQQYGEKLEVKSFELSESQPNAQLFEKFASAFGVNTQYVPATFIGKKYISYYDNDQTTGAQIKNLIDECLVLGCEDAGAKILAGTGEVSGNKNNTGTVIVPIALVFLVLLIILLRKKRVKNV